MSLRPQCVTQLNQCRSQSCGGLCLISLSVNLFVFRTEQLPRQSLVVNTRRNKQPSNAAPHGGFASRCFGSITRTTVTFVPLYRIVRRMHFSNQIRLHSLLYPYEGADVLLTSV